MEHMKNAYMHWIKQQRLRLAEQGFLARLKALLKKMLRTVLKPMVTWFDQHPVARRQALRVLDAMGLRQWIKKLQVPSRPRKKIVLSERAKEIRTDLKRALASLEES